LVVSHKFRTFVTMKAIDQIKSAAELQEEAFKEKAKSYLVCFTEGCPLHDQCLRWLVGRYADRRLPAFNAVNPLNPHNGGEQCEMFRPSQRVVMKRGFTNMYHEMPGYVEHRIRRDLIAAFGRKQYFQMRKGDRLVTPDQQQTILVTCRHHGWQGPIIYDGEQEGWVW